jgi:hypothetical protein
MIAVGSTDSADAGQAARPTERAAVRTIRADVEHYRRLAWTFARVARVPRKATSYSYRRSSDRAYLEWTLARWERTAYETRSRALARLHLRARIRLPHAPRPHAVLAARIAFSRTVTLRLRRVYPGRVSRRFARARGRSGQATLKLWQRRSADAALAVALHPRARRTLLDGSDPLVADFFCIHRFEGSWSANTGNGYYGGLQMDLEFMHRYGSDFYGRWGTADGWPVWAQVTAAERAYRAGRGFSPWPNSARLCGLL